jgi:hypothetical protein
LSGSVEQKNLYEFSALEAYNLTQLLRRNGRCYIKRDAAAGMASSERAPDHCQSEP